jgi:hypothetical protein
MLNSLIIFRYTWVWSRVGNFRQKNYSAEDGIDGTIGLFRRNSGCSTEQKTLGIPFITVPQRSRMLGILYHGTNIKVKLSEFHSEPFRKTGNSKYYVPNCSTEEKNARNSFHGKNRRLLKFRSEACLGQ